jgi:DNA polymerase beta
MKGSKKWQGIVRIPEKHEQGDWGSRSERLEGIANGIGTFKRLDLKWVLAILPFMESPLISE